MDAEFEFTRTSLVVIGAEQVEEALVEADALAVVGRGRGPDPGAGIQTLGLVLAIDLLSHVLGHTLGHQSQGVGMLHLVLEVYLALLIEDEKFVDHDLDRAPDPEIALYLSDVNLDRVREPVRDLGLNQQPPIVLQNKSPDLARGLDLNQPQSRVLQNKNPDLARDQTRALGLNAATQVTRTQVVATTTTLATTTITTTTTTTMNKYTHILRWRQLVYSRLERGFRWDQLFGPS